MEGKDKPPAVPSSAVAGGHDLELERRKTEFQEKQRGNFSCSSGTKQKYELMGQAKGRRCGGVRRCDFCVLNRSFRRLYKTLLRDRHLQL